MHAPVPVCKEQGHEIVEGGGFLLEVVSCEGESSSL